MRWSGARSLRNRRKAEGGSVRQAPRDDEGVPTDQTVPFEEPADAQTAWINESLRREWITVGFHLDVEAPLSKFKQRLHPVRRQVRLIPESEVELGGVSFQLDADSSRQNRAFRTSSYAQAIKDCPYGSAPSWRSDLDSRNRSRALPRHALARCTRWPSDKTGYSRGIVLRSPSALAQSWPTRSAHYTWPCVASSPNGI